MKEEVELAARIKKGDKLAREQMIKANLRLVVKIANAAEAFEVNVAPHNFYGHLCTMMSAHFSAAVPNLRIMETDIDRIAWDEELFTHVPEFVDGHLMMPDRPGWGTEPPARTAFPPARLTRLAFFSRCS